MRYPAYALNGYVQGPNYFHSLLTSSKQVGGFTCMQL